jgi:flavin reductase (DIM6/NTAB) family NADH-FMN oxidoreductase RutF
MECRFYKDIPVGDHYIVLLDVIGITLDRDIWKDDKVERRAGLPSVYYSTSGHFHELGSVHKVRLSPELRQYDNGD